MLNKIALLISTIFNLKYDIAPDIDATETQTTLVPTAILFSQPKKYAAIFSHYTFVLAPRSVIWKFLSRLSSSKIG